MDNTETTSNLRLSDERYRVFIEEISDGVYETDIHGNFIHFNNALCKSFGYPREEIQRQHFAKFMDKKHARKAYDLFSRIWATHEGFSNVNWQIVDKVGQTRMLELSAHLVRNQEGEKTGFRGIARDVTERFRIQEALRESEARYQRRYRESHRAERRAMKLLDFVPYPMVVFGLNGRVNHINPAFTETFGWTLDELAGNHIPYVPPDLVEETGKGIELLLNGNPIRRFETRRLTKDGRELNVAIRVASFSKGGENDDAELVILRDLTRKKRSTRKKEVLLRISTALPAYPDLGKLLDYISDEIRLIMNAEVAFVILLDEEKNEFSYVGAAHENTAAQKRIKEFRFPADRSVAGKVIRTGKPIVVPDTSIEPDFYPGVDQEIGYDTRNMIEVPLRGRDGIIGVLCARNKRKGEFDWTDVELLTMIAGTVALFIENAGVSEQLGEAYREVASLNKAKEKVINHLAHELKTPVSILMASLSFMEKKMRAIPKEAWKPNLERIRRNLNRILDIQYQVEDIMQDRPHKIHGMLSLLLCECTDELEALVADEMEEESPAGRIRERIEEIFGPKENEVLEIDPAGYLRERIEALKAQSTHREVEIVSHLEERASLIRIPSDVLQKVVDGLIRNAMENTPDGGKIEVSVREKRKGVEFVVHDYGVGITEENQKRIFEGFFVARDTTAYSTKRPFEFNAGGKGADLLRMKIFSERHHFKINMRSVRCKFIPEKGDICPGKISQCHFCNDGETCYDSGGTAFVLFFPWKAEPLGMHSHAEDAKG